jgi:ribosomal protein L37AE/L43A
MAFRLRNFAPLGPEEGLNGWLHKAAGWHRRLFGQPGDRYIRALIKENQLVKTVTQVDGDLAVCHICGYQMAAIVGDDGWIIEACSHSMAGKMFHNPRFDGWRRGLPALAETEPHQSARAAEQEQNSVQLQTSNH